MKINRTNYEAYFIDLLDGALTGNVLNEVLDFVKQNPDLAQELKGLEDLQLQADPFLNFDYQLLIKSDFDRPDVLEETCIRAIENDLSANEQLAFNQYLKTNYKAKNEYRLYSATISKPDLQVVYPNINQLKKTRTIAPFWYAVAAVFLLGLFFWFAIQNKDSVQQIAQNNEVRKDTVKLITKKIEAPNDFQKHDIAKLVPTTAIKIEEKLPENELKRSVESMEKIASISNVKVLRSEQLSATNLAAIKPKSLPIEEEQKIYPTLAELIAHRLSGISLKTEAAKLGKAALERISTATNDKLAYTTNSNGSVAKIEFNSKILAFSFPVK